MNDSPDDAGGASPWAIQPEQPAPPGASGKTVAVVLVLVTTGMAVVCCGLGGLAYYGLQQAVQPAREVALPDRSRRDIEDIDALAQALQNPRQMPHPDAARIQRWLARQVASAGKGQSIAPEADLFYAAVTNSPDGSQLNLLHLVQLRDSLRQGVPEPRVMDSYTILAIVPGAAADTARVSLVFYDDVNLPSLCSWFLVKTDGQWQLYDWFEADVGRRQSDEYAHYFRHVFDPHSGGYDLVVQWIDDAAEATAEGQDDRARRLLQRAAKTRCLPYDHDRALLYIGWGYQDLGDNAEAIRVFRSAKRPAEVPGIWGSLAISQLETGAPEAALQSVDQLRTVYADHPAADFLAARAYDQLGQDDRAAEHYLRCLAVCPDDSTVYSSLLLAAQPQHAADIVRAILASKQPDAYLLQLFDYVPSDSDLLAAVHAGLSEAEGAPPAWETLSQAWLQHASGDVGGALQRLTALGERDELSETLRERQEQWLVEWSLERGDLSQLRAREDFARFMQQAAEGLFGDELYPRPANVEAAVASLAESDQQMPAVAAMRGWAAWTDDRHEDAAAHFSIYLDAAGNPPSDDVVGDPASDDDNGDGIREEVVWRMTESLARLGRFDEAMSRFGDAPSTCWDVLEVLFQRRDREAAAVLRQRFADGSQPAAAMARAAIDATLAAWDGSAEAADGHWIACLRALDETDDSDLYVLDSVAEQRGITAARLHNVRPVIAEVDVPQWETTVQTICRETSSLMDTQLAKTVTAAVQQAETALATPAAEGQGLGEAVWEMNAAVAEQQHDWSAAAAHRRRLLEAADPHHWDVHVLRRNLLDAMLRSGAAPDDPQTMQLLEAADEEELWASYYLAHGMEEATRSKLSGLDSDQRGRWYTALINRPYVLHDRSLAQWFSESDQPLNIPYVTPAATVLLIESEYRPATAAEMRDAAAAALGSDVVVTQVHSGIDEDQQTRWAIRQHDALDVLVTQGRGSFTADQLLPEAVEQTLETSRGYVDINVLRSNAPARRLAFALAAQLSSPSTQLVYEDGSQYAWYGDTDGWADRLKWQQRLPVDAHTDVVGYLMQQSPPDEPSPGDGAGIELATPDEATSEAAPASGAMVDAKWLETRFAEQEKPVLVMLEIASQYTSERIAALATSIDAKTESVGLTLREDSTLLPALRQGDRVRAEAYNLVHP